MEKAASSSISAKIQFAACLLLPVVLYMIPTEWIMQGHSICLFRNLFGSQCYGCGMTRAIFSLLHADFQAAWEYNRLVVIVAPLLFYLYIKKVIFSIKALRK